MVGVMVQVLGMLFTIECSLYEYPLSNGYKKHITIYIEVFIRVK